MIANLIRGLLIGTAEVIPGVSGGTIALIVGIYERVIGSAAIAVDAALLVLRGRFKDSKDLWKGIDWGLILPVLAGMVAAIFAAASILEPLLESQSENMRALFVGLIMVSLLVPYKMVGSAWVAKDFVIGAAAAAVAFGLVSLPRQEVVNPNSLLVFLVASVAACALVLPGVSGSFLLLAMGFYAPTIAAVNDLDLAYLGIFVAGAVFGLAVFAKVLRWLLVNRRRVTLVVMTGLMFGSLRALWPWQDESGRALEAASFEPLGYFLLGAVIVVVLTWVQSRVTKPQ